MIASFQDMFEIAPMPSHRNVKFNPRMYLCSCCAVLATCDSCWFDFNDSIVFLLNRVFWRNQTFYMTLVTGRLKRAWMAGNIQCSSLSTSNSRGTVRPRLEVPISSWGALFMGRKRNAGVKLPSFFWWMSRSDAMLPSYEKFRFAANVASRKV